MWPLRQLIHNITIIYDFQNNFIMVCKYISTNLLKIQNCLFALTEKVKLLNTIIQLSPWKWTSHCNLFITANVTNTADLDIHFHVAYFLALETKTNISESDCHKNIYVIVYLDFTINLLYNMEVSGRYLLLVHNLSLNQHLILLCLHFVI